MSPALEEGSFLVTSVYSLRRDNGKRRGISHGHSWASKQFYCCQLKSWLLLCLYLCVRVWSELCGHPTTWTSARDGIQGQGCQLAMDLFLQTTNPIFVNKSCDDTHSHHLFWGHIYLFVLLSSSVLSHLLEIVLNWSERVIRLGHQQILQEVLT